MSSAHEPRQPPPGHAESRPASDPTAAAGVGPTCPPRRSATTPAASRNTPSGTESHSTRSSRGLHATTAVTKAIAKANHTGGRFVRSVTERTAASSMTTSTTSMSAHIDQISGHSVRIAGQAANAR